MLEFKKNINKLLPYDKEQYLLFMEDEDIKPKIMWYGFSIQINIQEKIIFSDALNILEKSLKKILSNFENSFWIINHDDKDLPWFIDNDKNLKELRTTFKRNNIKNNFKGSIFCSHYELIKLSRDLISYPYILSYKNLDISNKNIPIIIKTTSHLTIDVLSTEIGILNTLIKYNVFEHSKIIKYRGSEEIIY